MLVIDFAIFEQKGSQPIRKKPRLRLEITRMLRSTANCINPAPRVTGKAWPIRAFHFELAN